MLEIASPEPDSIGLRLLALRAAVDSLELEFAQVAVGFEASMEWAEDGFNSAYDWMRFNCHMTSTQVLSSLFVGEQRGRLEQSLEAQRRGEIGFAHLAVMARTAHQVSKAFDETRLLPLARKHSPGKFFQKCRHYVHSVDSGGYNREQESLAEGRSLRLSTVEDGCLLLSGVLDPVGGAAVRAALEPLAQPGGAHDHRNREQRLADALVERVTRDQKVEMQVTATVETLKAAVGAAAGEVEFGLPVSAQTVRRVACDCAVTRVLLDQESVVVDVGRSRRVVSPALRKALSIRDGHCRWPGCERPASWCDGHHLVHWADGGPTDLDNLALLCKRHHRMCHEGGWQLVRSDGDDLLAVAPTVRFGCARGPD